MDQTANHFLGREPVGRLMKKYAVPCIISLLVGALYNIVDQIFIANASYLGSHGNAANTVVFPLTVIALAIAVMIGDGCCAFVSLSLGKGKPDKARKSVGNSVLMTIVSSLILCAVYLIFSDGIIAMFGGTVNEETFRHSKEYFFYITLGIPFYMFGQLYRLGSSAAVAVEDENNYAVAATGDSEAAVMLTRYNDDDSTPADTISVDLCGFGGESGTEVEIFILDETRDLEPTFKATYYGDRFKIDLPTDNLVSYLIKLKKA